MADRDTLASVHGYSTCTTFPFSGTWEQADLVHIAGFYRGIAPASTAAVAARVGRGLTRYGMDLPERWWYSVRTERSRRIIERIYKRR